MIIAGYFLFGSRYIYLIMNIRLHTHLRIINYLNWRYFIIISRIIMFDITIFRISPSQIILKFEFKY